MAIFTRWYRYKSENSRFAGLHIFYLSVRLSADDRCSLRDILQQFILPVLTVHHEEPSVFSEVHFY